MIQTMNRRSFLKLAMLAGAGGLEGVRRLLAGQGSDYNRMPVGLIDTLQSSSLHGLSTSHAPQWAVDKRYHPPGYEFSIDYRFPPARLIARSVVRDYRKLHGV